MQKIEIEGLLYYDKGRRFFLSSEPFNQNADRYEVPPLLIKEFNLQPGTRLKAFADKSRVIKINFINGNVPDKSRFHLSFDKLTALNPTEKFDLGNSDDISLRFIDLVAPLAKGSRALIISPPRAGKTALLEKLAVYFSKLPQIYTILFLVDERPEEITHFRRLTDLPILSSSLDSDHYTHTKLADLLMKNIRHEIEAKNDVVVLIDSLTRLGRAHNLNDTRSGSRIMSGGIGAKALEIPRKLFGLARNIENGGSCTIIATILHETGSRMDEHIFQEFKGTGNCEIMLSRQLADMRIFPAIDIKQSGTRKEELLRHDSELIKINQLRRQLLATDSPTAINKLLNLITSTSDNSTLLSNIP